MAQSHEAVDVAAALTDAWNNGDGAAFGRQFTEDADFVNIFAQHIVGREGIARQHQTIFDTIYKGCPNKFTVVKERRIGADTIVAHIKAELRVPTGPMAGEIDTVALTVLVRAGEGWKIAAFHNTREQPPPEFRAPA